MADPVDSQALDCLMCAEVGAKTPAVETIRLALGERSGTVDLCADHLLILRSAVEPVLAASSRRSRRRPSEAVVPRLRTGEDREAIRTWAQRVGLPVSAAGTISAAVLERYRGEHATRTPRQASAPAQESIPPTEKPARGADSNRS